ncbi:MAG: molybdopterin converting factor subunit 1 [Hyphomicrobiaceae bacterium]|nr:molybdopterin converting factor subunit 1 [Hyphomicrobiaceae bacterium]
MTLRYFAWVRERVGHGDERAEVPATVGTVAELVAWLCERGPEYGAAFANPRAIRVAIDQQHAGPDASIAGAREVAFFPPVTGG